MIPVILTKHNQFNYIDLIAIVI